jgi:hypothetical protein
VVPTPTEAPEVFGAEPQPVEYPGTDWMPEERRRRTSLLLVSLLVPLTVAVGIFVVVMLTRNSEKRAERERATIQGPTAPQETGALTPKEREAATDAMKGLARVEAATQVGVNFQRYSELCAEAKAVVNEAEQILPVGPVRTALSGAMRAYKDAASLWHFKIELRAISDDLSDVKAIAARYRLEGAKVHSEYLGSDIYPESILQVVWLIAATKLQIARRAVAGESLSDTDKAMLEDTFQWYKAEPRQDLAKSDRETKAAKVEAAPASNKGHPGVIKASVSHFVGRWKLVDDKGVPSSYLTVTRDFKAMRDHARDYPGTWEVVGNEARFTWEDGIRDIMRSENGKMTYLGLGKTTAWDSPPNFRCRVIRIPN